MPSTVNLYQIGVWFCVGFFTGAGWGDRGVDRRTDLFRRLKASVREFTGLPERAHLMKVNQGCREDRYWDSSS
jgi:hypothetical protein